MSEGTNKHKDVDLLKLMRSTTGHKEKGTKDFRICELLILYDHSFTRWAWTNSKNEPRQPIQYSRRCPTRHLPLGECRHTLIRTSSSTYVACYWYNTVDGQWHYPQPLWGHSGVLQPFTLLLNLLLLFSIVFLFGSTVSTVPKFSN